MGKSKDWCVWFKHSSMPKWKKVITFHACLRGRVKGGGGAKAAAQKHIDRVALVEAGELINSHKDAHRGGMAERGLELYYNIKYKQFRLLPAGVEPKEGDDGNATKR